MTAAELEAQIAQLRARPLLLLCRTPAGREKIMDIAECVETGSAFLHVVCDDLDALLENELTQIEHGTAAERRLEMTISDSALQRHFETVLLLSSPPSVRKSREGKQHMRKMARRAAEAYRCGQSDARAGKPCADEIKETEDPSELVRATVQFAYTAYTAGYQHESEVD